MYSTGYLYTQKMARFEEKDIPGIGKIKVPQDGFASEETLQRLVKVMGGAPGGTSPAGSFAEGLNQSGKEAKLFGKELFKMTPGLNALQAGFNGLGRLLTGASGIAKAIMNLDGSFSSLKGVVDFTTDLTANTIGKLPIVGGFLTSAAAAAGEMTKLQLEFMDMQKGMFMTLSQSGRATANNLDVLTMQILNANISLEVFTDVVNRNMAGLRIGFGTLQNVNDQFVTNIAQMTSPESQFGMSLRLFGLTATEIANEFAEFYTVNRRNRMLSTIGETELQEAILERVKNERLMAEFTQMSVEEQRQAQMQQMGDAAFMAALNTKVSEENQFAMMQFTAGLEQFGLADVGKQILGFNQILDENGALIQSAAPGVVQAVRNAQEAIMQGEDPANAMTMVQDAMLASQQDLEQLVKLGIIPNARLFADAAGGIYLGSLETQNQLAAFNKATGQNFDEISDVLGYVATQYGDDIEQARKLADLYKDSEMSLSDFLRSNNENLNGVDDSVLRMIGQVAGLEEATGDMQRTVFTSLQGTFGDLADVTVALTSAFAKLLDEAVGERGAQQLMAQSQGLSNPALTGGGQMKKSGFNYAIAYDDQGQKYNWDEELLRYVPAKAIGGPMMPNSLALVGERGPEFLSMGNQGGEVINNATTKDIMSAANAVVDSMGTPNAGYGKQTLDVLTAMAKDQADTKRLLTRILPKAMTGNGYF